MGLDDEIVTRVRADTTDFDRGMQQAQQSAQRMATGVGQTAERATVGLNQMSAGYRGAATAMLGASNALSGLTGQAPAAVQRFQMIGIQVATMGSALSGAGGAMGALGMAINRAFPILALIGGAVTVATVAWQALTKAKTESREETEKTIEAKRRLRPVLDEEARSAAIRGGARARAYTEEVIEAVRLRITVEDLRQRRIIAAAEEEEFLRRMEDLNNRLFAARERANEAAAASFERARGLVVGLPPEAIPVRATPGDRSAAEAERQASFMARFQEQVGTLPTAADAAAASAERARLETERWALAIDAVTVAHQSLGQVLGSSVAAALDVTLGKSIQLVHADREAAKAAKAMELSKGEAAKVAARDAIKAIAAQAVVKAAFMAAEALGMTAAAAFGYGPGYAAAGYAAAAAAGYAALAGVAAGAASQIGTVRRTIPSGAGSRGGVATTTDPFGRAGFGPADTQDRRAPIIINIGADATSDPLAIAMAIERRLAGLSRERGSREFRV